MNQSQEQEKKEQERKIKQKIIESITLTVSNILKRQKNVKDPAIRYSMLVDKLCLVIDVLSAVLQTQLNDLSPELITKSEDLIKELQMELNQLMEWIQQPIHSPDHPYGLQQMNKAKKEFETKCKC